MIRHTDTTSLWFVLSEMKHICFNTQFGDVHLPITRASLLDIIFSEMESCEPYCSDRSNDFYIKHIVPVMIGDDCCERFHTDSVTHQMNLLTQVEP